MGAQTYALSDPAIYLIMKRKVKLTRPSPEGRPTILDIFGPGEIFGARVNF